jgi:hypothetical protein
MWRLNILGATSPVLARLDLRKAREHVFARDAESALIRTELSAATVRSIDNHKLMPGIEAGEIGPKLCGG